MDQIAFRVKGFAHSDGWLEQNSAALREVLKSDRFKCLTGFRAFERLGANASRSFLQLINRL